MYKFILRVIAGPGLMAIFYWFGIQGGMTNQAALTLGITAWVAYWWVSETLPIPVTSLLPMILFPAFSVLSMDDAANSYSDKLIWLYVGGFIIALALEKWKLHIRIAKLILLKMGTNLYKIVLAFMLTCYFLSMWISNTATALMMLPIAESLIQRLQGKAAPNFGKSLMLGVAYACSIGGIATLIGTPTNLVFSGMVEKTYGIDITFAQWFIIGFPISLVLLFIAWLILIYIFAPGRLDLTLDEIKWDALGYEEKSVLWVFTLVVVGWITRPWLIDPWLPVFNDTLIALTGALVLFVLPAKDRTQKIMDWETAKNLPWGIVLLFGGGLAIAKAFQESGLAIWFGENLSVLQVLPYLFVLLLVALMVNFLTEVTSNVATASVFMPVMAGVALAMDVHPFPLMAIVCMSASCAFMLPVATPPNAIVFGSGHMTMKDMARAGLWLNLISVGLISLYIYLIMGPAWNLELFPFPDALK